MVQMVITVDMVLPVLSALLEVVGFVFFAIIN